MPCDLFSQKSLQNYWHHFESSANGPNPIHHLVHTLITHIFCFNFLSYLLFKKHTSKFKFLNYFLRFKINVKKLINTMYSLLKKLNILKRDRRQIYLLNYRKWYADTIQHTFGTLVFMPSKTKAYILFTINTK